MKTKGFTASEGWPHIWKSFYNICQLNANSEKIFANKVEATLYRDELADIIYDHGIDQTFNTDEITLNYKMLPSKTLAVKADREVLGAKKWKECTIVLTGTNASESFYLRLLVTGKLVKPGAYKKLPLSRITSRV